MTATQMIPAVGQVVYLKTNALLVSCKVVDVKHAYGTARLQLEPVCGKGRTWVNLSSVQAMDAGQAGFGFLQDAQKAEVEDLWGVK